MSHSVGRQSTVVASVLFAIALALTFSFGGQSQATTPINTEFETRSCLDTWPPPEEIGCTDVLTAGAAVDSTTWLHLPTGSPNFNHNQEIGIASFTTPDATMHEDTVPIGAMVGAFRHRATLGLINGACSPPNNTTVHFALLNSTVDPATDGIIHPSLPDDAGDLGTLEYFGTDEGSDDAYNDPSSENGIPVHAEQYPSYLLAMFDPDFQSLGPDGTYGTPDDIDGPAAPVLPVARYSGYTLVAGMGWVGEYLTFAPGALAAAFSDPHPYSDFSSGLGYAGIFVLNDPIMPDAPSAISDFCTAFSTTHLGFGASRDNPCTDGSADPYTGPCNTDTKLNAASTTGTIPNDLWAGTPDTCDTDADESGCVRYRSPAANTGYANTGTHRYPSFVQTLRDADNDGIENAFDTCPFTATPGYDPRKPTQADRDYDPDDDAIPGDATHAGCDPTPNVNTGLGNHDGDVGGEFDIPYLNAQDNCPLAPNGTGGGEDNQHESELDVAWTTAAPNGGPRSDDMGDACDSEGGGSDTVANGHFHTFLNLGLEPGSGYEAVKCIGGTDSDGDGVCDATEDLLGSYKLSDGSTPENLSFDYAMPLTNRGSGTDDDADGVPNHDEPGPADDDAAGSADDQDEEPFQSCNDDIDNDLDNLTDNQEADCGGASANPDTDLDGIPDADETACGGDPYDATEVPERLGNSVDDDGDTSVDEVQAPVAGADCDGDGFDDDDEQRVGTGHQSRCADTLLSYNEADDQWPPDFNDDGEMNLSDIVSFVAPVAHFAQTASDPAHIRWDLSPGGALINIVDVVQMMIVEPPMFFGERAWANRMYGAPGRCRGDAAGEPGGPDDPPPGGSTIDNLRIDTDVTGNTATAVGTVETCVEILENDVQDGDEDAVDTAFIDVVVGPAGIPADRPLLGFTFDLEFPDDVVRVVSAVPDDHDFLLGAGGAPVYVPVDHPTFPHDSSPYREGTADFGGNNETGPGVLIRVGLESVESGFGSLSLSNIMLLDDANVEYPIDNVAGATIVVDEPGYCSSPDSDGDTIPDIVDNCPTIPNPGQENDDGDSHGNACDNCHQDNEGQEDFDHDDIGDVCDPCPYESGSTCDETVIGSCPHDITSPGTYVLSGDLVVTGGSAYGGNIVFANGSDYGIGIFVDGVTLDCNGHAITGPGPSDPFTQNLVQLGRESGPPLRVENVTVKNCELRDADRGIQVYGQGVLLANNLISNTGEGITFVDQPDNQLNLVTSNAIFDNEFNSNTRGIVFEWDGSGSRQVKKNTTAHNMLFENKRGLYIDWSEDNVFYNNYIARNTEYSLDPSGAANRWYFSTQPFTTAVGVNILGGTFLGGNFWDGYTGTDTNGDGIGDTDLPYTEGGFISSGDSLPLVAGDADGDTIDDDVDNCLHTSNVGQDDTDGDGIGDACEHDLDEDGVPNAGDNCLTLPNPNQADRDLNGVGDVCEPCSGDPQATDIDCDGDGFTDAREEELTWPDKVGYIREMGDLQCHNTTDDDGDTVVNDGCPSDGTDPEKKCARTSSSNDEEPGRWPADFDDNGRLNLQDVNGFNAPIKHYGEAADNHRRWNLAGGPDINLQDVNTLNTLAPYMFDGERAFGNTAYGLAGTCPADAG